MKTKNKFICIHILSQVSNKKIQSRLSFSPCLNFTLSQIKYVRLYLTGCCFNRFSKKSLNCFLKKFYFIFSNSHDFGVTSKGIKSSRMNSIQGLCVFKVQSAILRLKSQHCAWNHRSTKNKTLIRKVFWQLHIFHTIFHIQSLAFVCLLIKIKQSKCIFDSVLIDLPEGSKYLGGDVTFLKPGRSPD